jgi:hypothetical protein
MERQKHFRISLFLREKQSLTRFFGADPQKSAA